MSQTLSPEGIRRALHTRWAGQGTIFYAPEMDSTNTRLKAEARGGAPHGSLALCEMQTAGRGRLDRSWETPRGEALTHSLLLRPTLPVDQAQLCTLAAALAMTRAIRECCPGLCPGIKWPNDVVIGSRKCVGVLSEMSATAAGIEFVITGVGLNVNQLSFPDTLSDKATSLLMELRRQDPDHPPLSRQALLCAYLQHMEQVMEAVEKQGFAGIREEYAACSVTIGRRVQVLSPAETFVGLAMQVDDTGALLVEAEQGQLRQVLCGDVSVRGLMGYV